MLTRKEAKRIVGDSKVLNRGYCCVQDYCDKYNISKYDLKKIGYNAGVYGWNWTLYLDTERNVFICDSYRNAPRFENEKELKDL